MTRNIDHNVNDDQADKEELQDNFITALLPTLAFFGIGVTIVGRDAEFVTRASDGSIVFSLTKTLTSLGEIGAVSIGSLILFYVIFLYVSNE